MGGGWPLRGSALQTIKCGAHPSLLVLSKLRHQERLPLLFPMFLPTGLRNLSFSNNPGYLTPLPSLSLCTKLEMQTVLVSSRLAKNMYTIQSKLAITGNTFEQPFLLQTRAVSQICLIKKSPRTLVSTQVQAHPLEVMILGYFEGKGAGVSCPNDDHR